MNALPRFLRDKMLGRLCRYLRAASYDALLCLRARVLARLTLQARVGEAQGVAEKSSVKTRR